MSTANNPPDVLCPCCGQSLGIPVLPLGAVWTDAHDAALLMFRKGWLPWKLIGRAFDRSGSAVKARWYLLTVAPGPTGTPKPASRPAISASGARR